MNLFETTDAAPILNGLEVGRMVTVIVTNSALSATLQFLDPSDGVTWLLYPGFSGAKNSEGTIIADFRCNSASMRLNFGVTPGTVQVQVITHSQSEF